MAVFPTTISEFVLRELESHFLSATGLCQQILVAFLIEEACSSRMVLFQAEGYMFPSSLFPISEEEKTPLNKYSIPPWTDWNSELKCLFWSTESVWSKLKRLSIHVHNALNRSFQRNIFPRKDFILKNSHKCKGVNILHLVFQKGVEIEAIKF